MEHEREIDEKRITILCEALSKKAEEQKRVEELVIKMKDEIRQFNVKTAQQELQMSKNQNSIGDLATRLEDLYHFISQLRP